MNKPVRVLIVDDSATVRETLVAIFASDPEIEVMGIAADPFAAARRIREEVPHVITLDVEMPRMDGLTFLRKIMSQHPVPVVICSSHTPRGAESALRAFDYGAVEVIYKPRIGARQYLEEARILICDAVKAAAATRPERRAEMRDIARKLTADVIMPGRRFPGTIPVTERIVVVGASTGGTEALKLFLEGLPQDCPGIVIVQHMPGAFTGSFARRLDGNCRIRVREATNLDRVMPGVALIAPGDSHLLLKRNSDRYYVEMKEGPLVCRHRPSVDVLFRSAARYAGQNAVGILMTGMGDDGARGLKEMRDAGAVTIAQDEASSVVFGMPREAILRGGAGLVLSLASMAQEVMKICGSSRQEQQSPMKNIPQ